MELILTVSSPQRTSLGADATKHFRLHGGTIGRGRDNDWTLPDAERVISSQHARIRYENGAYSIEDTSSNGTFINAAQQPLRRGEKIILNHGDTLHIGEYEIDVELEQERAGGPSAADSHKPPEPAGAMFIPKPYPPRTDMASGGIAAERHEPVHPGPAYAPPHWPESRPGTPDRDRSGLDDDLGEIGAQGDHAAADLQAFVPPSASPELIPEDKLPPASETIPEDWWKTDEAQESAPAEIPAPMADGPQVPAFSAPDQPTPEAAPRVPVIEPDIAPADAETLAIPVTTVPEQAVTVRPDKAKVAQEPQRPTPARTQDRGADLIASFYEGLGISPPDTESDADLQHRFRQLGHLLRMLTQATLDLMQARSSLKSEFRLSQTIVRPTQNNPLKFSVDADQALQQLFVEQRPGFMGPEAAFTEAMSDIREHEIAVVAGMRAAFDCLLKRLDPALIETELKARGKHRPALPFSNRTWAFYKEYYEEFKSNAGDDFQGIFGEDFVRAYEDQVALLSSLHDSHC